SPRACIASSANSSTAGSSTPPQKRKRKKIWPTTRACSNKASKPCRNSPASAPSAKPSCAAPATTWPQRRRRPLQIQIHQPKSTGGFAASESLVIGGGQKRELLLE